MEPDTEPCKRKCPFALPGLPPLRSKETKAAMERAEEVLRTDNSDRIREAVAAVVPDAPPAYPHFALDAHVAKDADVIDWVDANARSRVGRAFLHHLIRHPCTDVDVLRARAAAPAPLAGPADPVSNADQEAAALWALTLPPLGATWPMPFLFPTWPVLRLLNNVPLFLDALHAYRLWLSPAMQLAYPLLLVIGPWLFVRQKLGMKLGFVAYVKMAVRLLKAGAGAAGGLGAGTWLTVAIYFGLYIYGVAQTVDVARVVYKWRKALKEKVRLIVAFYDGVRAASLCLHGGGGCAELPAAWGLADVCGRLGPLPPLGLPTGVQGAYRLWTCEKTKARIADALRWHALLDVLAVKDAVLRTGATVTWKRRVRPVQARLWNMRHPALAGAAGNPLSLVKNVIVTGPNAAGKTTYLRAALANALLAQTLGVVCASRAELAPFRGIATFMRVADETGRASLFEAEVNRCIDMWKRARDGAAGGGSGPFLMLLDEPMHATPPTEGAAAAMAFLRLVGGVPGVRVMVTTHYHEVTDLAALAPAAFVNVSMEADVAVDGTIAFPYRLRAGPSFQCIALELMRNRDFPDAFIRDAIKMKNKICRALVRATP